MESTESKINYDRSVKSGAKKHKLFKRDFSMVVVGQIISLFGNNILRYALPLYLLNTTGSASLYGIVLALSFIPMLLLSPVGGIIADRVNKRNVMVCLDFSTAALILFYTFTYKSFSFVPLLIVVLMLLFGIQGAYQPTVQASLPVLVERDNLMTGNAVINGVNSLAEIVGPALGGLLMGLFGIAPILYISICCFIISAIMEIFIHIPFEKAVDNRGIFSIVKTDTEDSFKFITHTRPDIGKAGLIIAAINLVFSAIIVIGIPIIINTKLGFSQSFGNQLYGYAQGGLAAGGLLGALLAGSVCKKLSVQHSHWLIFLCTLTLLPIAFILMFKPSGMIAFFVITVSCMITMILCTIFSIQIITYAQKATPESLLGKVLALMTCLVMLGHPIGQAIYGQLFEVFTNKLYVIFFGAFFICLAISYASRLVFKNLKAEDTEDKSPVKAEQIIDKIDKVEIN